MKTCGTFHVIFFVLGLAIMSQALVSSAAEPLEPRSGRKYDFTPLCYNNPSARPFIKVGLIGSVMVFDYEGDGDKDVVIGCGGIPTWFGTWLFENPSAPGVKDPFPLFKPAVKVATGQRDLFAKTYPDGRVAVTHYEDHIADFHKTGWKGRKKFKGLKQTLDHGQKWLPGNVWTLVDYDDDGREDIVVGIGDRKPYGWDDAYNANGVWTNGSYVGMLYFVRNETPAGGSEKWAKPQPVLMENMFPVEVYGNAVPMFQDWDGDGDLDIICGDWMDGFTWFENIGTRKKPVWTSGRFLRDSQGRRLQGDLCIMTPTAVDWDNDGKMDFISSEEDGRAAFYRNTGRIEKGMPVFEPPVYLRGEADKVHCGILVTPAGTDWDGDGDIDIICGNSAGYIAFIENLSGPGVAYPKWAEPVYLSCGAVETSRGLPSLGGVVSTSPLRIMAGYNGSIQGPGEAKWGYTCLSVADWDGDGLSDIMVNTIWGKLLFFRNVGTRSKPLLAAPTGVSVEWEGAQPELKYGWYKPSKTDCPDEIITQWRTTPVMFDMNQDGLMDLIVADTEGYLAFFERYRRADGKLALKAPRRAFKDAKKDTLIHHTPSKRASKPRAGRGGSTGRRKLTVCDWDGDGKADLIMSSRNACFYRQIGMKDGNWLFAEPMHLSEQQLSKHSTSPTTVDFDNDGIPEILLGCEDGFFYHLKNNDWKK